MGACAGYMTIAKKCEICFDEIHLHALLCKRCKKLIERRGKGGKRQTGISKRARIEALKSAWDGESFRCYYSGVKLEEADKKSPVCLTFDHRIPRDDGNQVVTTSILNDMKSDMSEDEFKAMVMELAKRWQGGQLDEKVFNLKHYKR